MIVNPMIVAPKASVIMPWSVVRRACVHVLTFSLYTNFLLRNYKTDFDEISQKCSCHGPLLNFLKEFDSLTRGP